MAEHRQDTLGTLLQERLQCIWPYYTSFVTRGLGYESNVFHEKA